MTACLRKTKQKNISSLTRGEKVCEFIFRYCRIPEGEKIGQPMRLDKFQRKFIIDIYDNPYGTHSAYLSIARKNGKTGLIAALLLAHLAGPEAVQNSQIVSGAQSKDQASVVFELARKMVDLSPELSRVVRVQPSGKRLIGLWILYKMWPWIVVGGTLQNKRFIAWEAITK